MTFRGAEERDTGGPAGRGLFAMCALSPGTLVGTESPWVWRVPLLPASSAAAVERAGRCHYCLAESTQLKRCGGCHRTA